MRLYFILSIIVISITFPVFADSHKAMYGIQEGSWAISDNNYMQKDTLAPRAKAWARVPQNSDMVYEFSMHYEGGGEDGHGGVGVHILADRNLEEGISWGLSDSWLLWLNYDVSPENNEIPQGLSAQIYKSNDDSSMDLVASVSLKEYEDLLMRNLNAHIPVSIRYYSKTGRLTIADPSGNSMGWYVDLPDSRNETGSYVAARTNGLSVSFASSEL